MSHINQYRLTIERISQDSDITDTNQSTENTLSFNFEDREDVLTLVQKLKQGSGLDEQSATQLAVALRLMGPVMMAQHKHPLFVDFMPHFKTFMANLKRTVKSALR
ncbi:hypothetical protein VST7929_01453 [Vibrio stylophorae]|uniref:DUF3861 domain-containing protein n=1 Tax=Vibrio stylophorae TaxID=659351 RepID=A0ABN8DTC6_9VIBR|nr:DUF3861 domain-containing protein [Vibrio stylophorae]CAH0533583.1 hypothetical protein VST7929_01453 [Vibrio stylophorae]